MKHRLLITARVEEWVKGEPYGHFINVLRDNGEPCEAWYQFDVSEDVEYIKTHLLALLKKTGFVVCSSELKKGDTNGN